MKHIALCILALLLVAACKPTVPSKYIQPDEMEDILYDYHVAQAMSKTDGAVAEYQKQVYVDAVLKKHGITEAEFDSSLVYYYTRADRLKDIYARVSERLNDEAKVLGAGVGEISRYSQYSTTGDTANIWNQTSEVLLIPRPTQNRFDFTIKVDTTFHLGDSFMFQFMSEFLYQSGAKDAVVCLLTKYEGDSIIQTVYHASVEGLVQVRVPANRENKLKEMRGYIYLSNGGDVSDTRKLMYISQLQLIRFHDKEKWKDNDIAKKDTIIQADSLQRIDNPGGPVPDTLRRRVFGRRQGGTPIRPVEGAALHRVEARPVVVNEVR